MATKDHYHADPKRAPDIVQEARERYEDAHTNDFEQRERVIDDIEFAYDPEAQWDEYVKANRSDRPCLSFNRIEPAIDQIVGDQRRTRLGIHVSPTEAGDKPTAKVLAGLIRNIEAISDIETVGDEQFEAAVAGGFGALRIVNDYNNDDNFDQDAFIRGVRDPANQVWFDPSAEEWHKQDGEYMFVSTWISQEAFARQFPDFTPSNWDSYKDTERWRSDKLINVCEYYRKAWMDRDLVQLSDGSVRWKDEIDKIIDQLESAELKIENTRKVKTYKIEWFRLSGWDVLEGPVVMDWKYFPIVPIWGKRRIIRGKEHYKGMTRNARDAQKSYNYVRSTTVEAAALTPKAPWLVTANMVDGLKSIWKKVTTASLPYLPYKHDPDVPQGPQRQDFQQVPATLIALSQQDAADIQAVTGVHDPSLGVQQTGQQSGQAIGQVQQQADTGSYRYIDNLSKSMAMCGKILVDIIPSVYDTQRTIRIIGEDGTKEWVEINARENGEAVNDLARGKYDVIVDVGPTHKSQRVEAAKFLETVVPSSPMLQDLAMDIVFKYQDVPGADEIHQRLRNQMISQGKIQPEEDNEEEMKLVPQDQGPSEGEMLLMRAQLAEILNTEADTETKLAKVYQTISDAYKKQMEGSELEVQLAADAAVGADNIAAMMQPIQQDPRITSEPPPQQPQGAPPGMQPPGVG
jgi:hypothetical protein